MPRVPVKPRWKKGESGNPTGRPRGYSEFRKLCRDATPECVQTLLGVMSSKKAPPSAKVSAATVLLNHGWGSPAQTVTVNDERTIHELTRSELLALLAAPDRAGTPGEDGRAAVADPLH